VRARAFNLAARGPISLWQLAPRALQPKRLRRSMCTVEAKVRSPQVAYDRSSCQVAQPGADEGVDAKATNRLSRELTVHRVAGRQPSPNSLRRAQLPPRLSSSTGIGLAKAGDRGSSEDQGGGCGGAGGAQEVPGHRAAAHL